MILHKSRLLRCRRSYRIRPLRALNCWTRLKPINQHKGREFSYFSYKHCIYTSCVNANQLPLNFNNNEIEKAMSTSYTWYLKKISHTILKSSNFTYFTYRLLANRTSNNYIFPNNSGHTKHNSLRIGQIVSRETLNIILPCLTFYCIQYVCINLFTCSIMNISMHLPNQIPITVIN